MVSVPQRIDSPEDLLAGRSCPLVTCRAGRVTNYADGLRDLPEDRRLAILAVCVSEWQAMLADAVVETHGPDRRPSLPCFGAYLPCKGRRRSGGGA